MGYYVSYSGSFEVQPLPADVRKDIEDFDLDGIEILESGNRLSVDIYGCDKYHSDDWDCKGSILDMLLPYVIKGEIEFHGEDDDHWCYKYDPGLRGFIYGSGRIVYNFQKEVWNFE